jgi:phage baseplate assembly protein W
MGGKIMPEIAIALPFTIDPYGKVTTTTDQSKIWADRVRSVLGTAVRERVMRSEFGTFIPYTAFDTQEEAQSTIENEVKTAFLNQLPLLSLGSVSSTFDEFTGIINITVIYALPNDQQVSTTIGLASIKGTTPIYEESL